MRVVLSFFILPATASSIRAQKRPLDHSVYDGRQRIGERVLSSDGKFLAYTVIPEEGDGSLLSVQQPVAMQKRYQAVQMRVLRPTVPRVKSFKVPAMDHRRGTADAERDLLGS